MNDLMTKSFLSYVELKKQARKDGFQSETDMESGFPHSPDEPNLSLFFQEVTAIKTGMEEITNLLFDLQNLDQEAKSTHSNKILRGLRDRMESDILSVLKKAKTVKSKLESLDKSKEMLKEGSSSSVYRTRITVTNGLKVKLKEILDQFQILREKILSDYKADIRRKYYAETGEEASEEVVEKIVFGGEMYKDRHEGVMELQRSLTKLHQVFLDMAVIVETQGEKNDCIEENVVNAVSFINGGTNGLYYANQRRQKTKPWVYWVWAVFLIVLLVCIVSMFVS